ncbi:MAG: thioredoxin family protein [Tetragenococcus koreensis]|uniref:Thioredoxin family protein n=2 Tax=Tetragenococcus halophilus TaxID=51669 RepID=A0AB35HRG5_TETHA|nr:thioredoxin family protein [Tetragenococcus halophilus]MDN6139372.1 thioredoxin family protein [Tetragenococcus koreensis]MDN6641005.1 thioredoxin family protein [Tetragenococcus sp.]MCO8296245.1 thioredoxin family protein [Tetragenococcus halophilus]MCO8298772.1 thioredoxin family protein [Tetragenococcus halophilus]MDN6145940.1 thioredoxin family protein [Tetragenococcus koreensis]
MVVVAISTFITHMYVNNVEKQRESVQISKETNKVLFFYKDTCPSCQEIFHQVYWLNKKNDNILFINMNQPNNEKYIAEYQLQEVPTFITNDDRYTGTDKEEIKKIVGENNETKIN